MKELLKRLKYVAGQLTAIEQMIREKRPATEIHIQLQSVQSAFQKSIMLTFETHNRKSLAALVVSEQDRCPGACPHCDLMESIKRDFPNLSLNEVLHLLQELQTREENNDA